MMKTVFSSSYFWKNCRIVTNTSSKKIALLDEMKSMDVTPYMFLVTGNLVEFIAPKLLSVDEERFSRDLLQY
jgi:hypothetical protein